MLDPNVFFINILTKYKEFINILDDVIEETHKGVIDNTVYGDLKKLSSDTFKSLYLLAFKTYEGFDQF